MYQRTRFDEVHLLGIRYHKTTTEKLLTYILHHAMGNNKVTVAHVNVRAMNLAYDLQARLYLERCQPDVALEWARRSHDLLRGVNVTDVGNSVEWGRYERLMGCIAQARGDLGMARRHIERSAALFRANGSPLEAGRTAFWSGLLWLEPLYFSPKSY